MSTPFGLVKQTFFFFTTGLMNQCMISPILSVPGFCVKGWKIIIKSAKNESFPIPASVSQMIIANYTGKIVNPRKNVGKQTVSALSKRQILITGPS